MTLKRDGRIRAPGALFGLTAVLLLTLTAHNAAVQFHRGRAVRFDRDVTWSQAEAMSLHRESPPGATKEAARQAAHHYRQADRVDRGGIGLLGTPEVTLRRAWLALVLGDFDEAAEHLQAATPPGEGGRRLRLDRARVLRLADRKEEAMVLLERLVAEDPGDLAAHRELSALLLEAGRLDEAAAELVVLVNLAPGDEAARTRLVDVLERLGRHDAADRYRR